MNPIKDVGVEKTRLLTYKVYVSMGSNSVKIVQSEIINHIHIISSYHRKEVYIVSNESDETCSSCCGDKIMVGKIEVSMGDNSLKNSRIKIPKSHAHLHIRIQ